MKFGPYVRKAREKLKGKDRRYSLRQVAKRIGVEAAYLSKVERSKVAPPSEGKIVRLAGVIGEDPDAMLALAGKVSTDVMEIIRGRPQLYGRLLRGLRGVPDRRLREMAARAVRGDG
jgi:transcriptional regulator with XRE-family HTH domain